MDLFLMRNKNGKIGVKDQYGNQVVECKYDFVSCFFEGLATVKLNDKYGFIDVTGKEVIECKYDDVSCFFEGLARVNLDGKYGFIDKTGKQVVACKYDRIEEFEEGLAKVRLNEKWGRVDKTGKEVVECKYDESSLYALYKTASDIWYGQIDISDISDENALSDDFARLFKAMLKHYASETIEAISATSNYTASEKEKFFEDTVNGCQELISQYMQRRQAVEEKQAKENAEKDRIEKFKQTAIDKLNVMLEGEIENE